MLPSPKVLQVLFYLLLRQISAHQLASLHRDFDQLFPFYMGKADEPFDPNKAGANVVLVKNRKRPSSVDAVMGDPFFSVNEYEGTGQRKVHKRFEKSTLETLLRTAPAGLKYLLMLLDLNIGNVSVKVSESKESQPRFWAIHSSGHDARFSNAWGNLSLKFRKFFEKQFSNLVENNIGFTYDTDQLYSAIHSAIKLI